jgi:hypothetical protein
LEPSGLSEVGFKLIGSVLSRNLFAKPGVAPGVLGPACERVVALGELARGLRERHALPAEDADRRRDRRLLLRKGQSRWTTGDYIKVCAEHREELDVRAQTAVGGALQDGCGCVVRHAGTAGRISPPTAEPPAAATPLPRAPVVGADGFRRVEAPAIIPFEPKGAALITARAMLRAAMGTLSAASGELLHGVIEGEALAGTDLDNALLYNIGGPIAGRGDTASRSSVWSKAAAVRATAPQ